MWMLRRFIKVENWRHAGAGVLEMQSPLVSGFGRESRFKSAMQARPVTLIVLERSEFAYIKPQPSKQFLEKFRLKRSNRNELAV